MAFRFNKKYNSSPRNILFNLKVAHDVAAEISRFKGNASGDLYLELLFKMANTRAEAYDMICGIPEIRSYSDFFKANFMRAVELEREVIWQASILKMFSEKINSFSKALQEYFHFMLLKQPAETLSKLDDIVLQYGLSIWSIENNIAILGIMDGPDGVKGYTNNILETTELHPFFKTIIDKLGDRALPTVSWKRYDMLIDTLTQEFKDTNQNAIANYVGFILNYYNTIVADTANHILASESQFPITDRYLAFMRCIQALQSSNNSKSLAISINKALKYLSKGIDDLYLSNILNSETGARINYDVLKAYDYYTSGAYCECISLCESILLCEPQLSELYDIYVRSVYRLENYEISFAEGSLLNKILNLMLKILPKNDDAKESYNELLKIVYVFSSNPYMANIYYFCCREFRCYSKDTYRQLKRYCELNSSYLTPRAIAYQKIAHNNNYVTADNNLSVNFLTSVYRKEIKPVESLTIPYYRKQKYIARIHEANNNLDEAIQIYSDLESSSDSLTAIEAVLAKLGLYLLKGDVENCLIFLIEKYFKYQLPPTKLPLKELLYELEKQSKLDIAIRIELLIAYDIYNKNISSDRLSKMYDAFDEFIYCNGMQKPHEILDNNELLPEYKLYFLKYICIPDVMDSSDCFKTNNEVLTERVKICLMLQEIDPVNYIAYTNEVEEILTSLIISKASSKIGTGRIFIDTAGITKLKKNEYVDAFQKYLALPDDASGEFKLIQYDETGERFLPGSPKDQVLISIFEELTNEFIHNRDYGLDGNLSLEIRHGQLESLCWVPLEKLNLITKKDDKGCYQRNEHWWRTYEIFSSNFRDEIDAALKEFSKGIDESVETLKNEWFVAKARSGNFSFAIGPDDLEAIKMRLSDITTYDLFYASMVEIAIEITDENLRELRNKVYSEVPLLFDKAFHRLNESLINIKRHFALHELEAQIALGRNEIHKAVDELVSLLDFVNKHDSPDFQIYVPLNLSIDAFKNTYSHKDIRFNLNVCDTPMIHGRYLHDFVRIFLTLFDNIIRRSGLENLPPIDINVRYDNHKLEINLKNQVNTNINVQKTLYILKEIKEKLSTKTYSDIVNKEGKSGFYKIDKILTVNVGCEHSIYFNITDKYEFIVNLQIDIMRIMV